MDRKKLVFLDTETTGIKRNGRLCQIAYKFADLEAVSLFKPPVPIEIGAMAVAHITNRMVADKEPFIGSRMHKELQQIFSAGNIMVAHNARFDVEILEREGLAASQVIDTFKIAHHLDVEGKIERYTLQYLRYYFDLEIENAPAHDALGDVRVTEKIFDHLFAQMKKTHVNEEEVLRSMLEISARPILMRILRFGKYSGRKVSEVAVENIGYLAWLLNEKIKERERGGKNDENWIFTLDFYLKLKSAEEHPQNY